MDVREVSVKPELFSGFAHIRLLGTGRRSTVYRAVELATSRPVALKVVRAEHLAPAAVEAFAREAAVLAALGSHPNIVTLYRTLPLAPSPVLVLELCRGSVADRLRTGPLPVAEALRIGVGIAGALETAHSAGVLHRNVSPSNILITEFGEPALADFAIARLYDSHLTAGIPAAELLDAPGVHTAPELLLGQPADERTDVYSLASTLYQMVEGRPPFGEWGGEPAAATILRILRDAPRPPVGVPIELADLLLWGLAKEPADRPPSAAWFADELRRVETHAGWPRTHLRVREVSAPLATPPAPLLMPSVAPPPPVVTDPAALAGAPAQRRTPVAGRTVVRGSWLTSLGAAAALAGPIVAAGIAALLATRPGPLVLAAAALALACVAVLAGWFARPVLVLDSCHLQHRDGLDRVLIPWPAVAAVRAEFEPSRRPGAPHAVLVVEASAGTAGAGPVPLSATRRSAWQLPGLQALVLQYRDAARKWNTF